MTPARALLAENPIVPVVVLDDAANAPELVAALAAGGIRCAEFTLRTPAGLGAIAAVAGTADFAVGAGTVLSLDDLERSVDAGATFLVSPGFDDELVERAMERGVAVLPGVATGTEVQRAAKAGLDTVKFFPADRLGGLPTIAALAAPFVGMGFVPSGGVTGANAPEYLAHPAVPAVSGSWMAPRSLIGSGDFEAIERLSSEAVVAIGRA
ncbi:bifunctional 4-hydroxy-2-oxoglutarate aldolase/2-dehydro-3-deoxy-phosphogluconate aldolase [Naasia sp. SYSU D00057]|uniref:bifunctional 4-hydroxy-2-oxoglutarate aldolase/2-dehydro-3-deoxy-phosphogluconate aldolase n=1 Tax=Naasia sp. SYSU D00057 TaxID=2817380 RepID=UPI001B301378|nr:bifunctional 4-hydroxy-2-oxoglutarate aldolase/2-dehydro-3-deoxy-phosphogluconate aldolase [Naasia sp. SYSU D00057]